MATMVNAKVSPPARGSTSSTRNSVGKIVTPSHGSGDMEDETLHKRMTVERGVVDELLLVCGVIGTTTDDGRDELVPVTDCLNWLQDLQRALRRDDDTFRPISLLLGKWKILQQKLLPLVMTCRYDTPMVLTIVKILVILTKPLGEATKRAGRQAIDCKKLSDESVKEHIKLRDNALAQSNMLMDLKRAMTHHHSSSSKDGSQQGGLLSVFVSLLAEPLSKTGSARTDVDHLTIELVLHLFRNLLAAEPLLKSSSDISQGSIQLQHELVCLFDRELVLEILLVVAQDMESRENQNYNLLLMELLNLLLKSHDPTKVARSTKVVKPGTAGYSKESAIGTSMLKESLKKEKQKYRGLITSRHSNFGGTLMINRPDGKRQYISAGLLDTNQSQSPPAAKKRRNRKREAFVGSTTTAHDGSSSSPMTPRAQQIIHKFCERFVTDCYGPLMKSLKNEFRRDSVRLEEGDTVVFFRIIWFFSQWLRICRKESLGHLIFTMDVFTFKLVLGAMDTYIQQKKYPQLAQTTALYSEMMHMLHTMYTSKDSTENIMAMGLMDTLFYGSEPIDNLPKLLSKWEPGTSTREHLCDIAEVVHMTLKMLEVNHAACMAHNDNVVDDNARKTKKDKKAAQKRDAIARMKANAADFDVTSYFLRKIVSNQVVSMYTHLLSQYAVNAPHVNHRIIAFLMRLQKVKIAVGGEDGDDHPEEELRNQLATNTVTLEPMLYNINMIMVLEKILNDDSIQNDKDYSSLLAFSTRLICHFAESAQNNPLLYVECLFRHPVPHRFCEYTTNHYVNEELRMLAEREILLEESRRMMDHEEEYEKENEEQGLHLAEAETATGLTALPPNVSVENENNDDDEDEIEWDDHEHVSQAKVSKDKSKKLRKKPITRGILLSDSDDDSDKDDVSTNQQQSMSKRKLQDSAVVQDSTSTKKKLKTQQEDSSDDEELDAVLPKNVGAKKAWAQKNQFLSDSSDDDDEMDSLTTESKNKAVESTEEASISKKNNVAVSDEDVCGKEKAASVLEEVMVDRKLCLSTPVDEDSVDSTKELSIEDGSKERTQELLEGAFDTEKEIFYTTQ